MFMSQVNYENCKSECKKNFEIILNLPLVYISIINNNIRLII